MIEVNTRGAGRLAGGGWLRQRLRQEDDADRRFTDFIHFRVSDLGLEQGKTPVTDERVGMVAAKLRELLGRQREAAEA